MSNISLDKVKTLLESAFSYAKQNELPSPIDLAQLGNLIRFYDNEFSPQQYGYEKLRPLLEQMPDVIEIIKDDTISPPRFFAKYFGIESINAQAVVARQKSTQPASNRDFISKNLSEFAVIIKAKWQNLADLALDECWGGIICRCCGVTSDTHSFDWSVNKRIRS